MMKAWVLAGALVQQDIPSPSPINNELIFDTIAISQEIEISLNEQMARLIEQTQHTLMELESPKPTLASQIEPHFRQPLSPQE
ncbi:hypothetical protein [uncultured Shewanella sp.]|uniref:hypothetical protein n=1 Tax=uncultured Shewanella sp. TaxID=173975 RepID=UPI00262A1328|nr:hypothetical protein [uncultured Shewanella sp.]